MELKQIINQIGHPPTENSIQSLEYCKKLKGFIASCEDSKTELSIVIPVYNEEDSIKPLLDRLLPVLHNLKVTFEIIFVDDGSKDKSGSIIKKNIASNPQIVYLKLARNFGQQVAYSAGLEYANGQKIVMMDSDLQDPPESIPNLINKMQTEFDVVYAIRASRQESIFLRFCYKVYYRLLKFLANVDIPIDAGDFCVINRRVLDQIKSMPERSRFLRGLRSWVGFKQTGILIDRGEREAGQAKYTFTKLLGLAFDGIFSFSLKPLHLIVIFGISVSIFSGCLAIYFLAKKILIGLSPPGFAATVVMISFFAGAQLVTLGIIGQYVGRIFNEVKQRPIFIISEIYKKD